jgi:nucleotide-binding universal stress UspA family protein
MFERILVPLEGSALAECVLPHATAIAQAVGAQLC